MYVLGSFQTDRLSRIAPAYAVLLRLPAASLADLDLSQVEILSRPSVGAEPDARPEWRRWGDPYDAAEPHALFSPMETEASLLYHGDRWRSISLYMLGKHIQVAHLITALMSSKIILFIFPLIYCE